jgi:hypothetical protein
VDWRLIRPESGGGGNPPGIREVCVLLYRIWCKILPLCYIGANIHITSYLLHPIKMYKMQDLKQHFFCKICFHRPVRWRRRNKQTWAAHPDQPKITTIDSLFPSVPTPNRQPCFSHFAFTLLFTPLSWPSSAKQQQQQQKISVSKYYV